MSDQATPAPFLSGGGEMGALIAAHDWASTSLGPIETWPQSLKAAVGMVLLSPVPIVMLWGPDGIMIYNDAYSIFAGGRHPRLLGSKVREGWPEVADFNDNVMKVGLSGGTLSFKDQELTLYRHGRPEQVRMNLDYSPLLDESGRPAGVIAIVVETTERITAERNLREATRRLDAILNNTEMAVFLMNDRQQCVFANSAAEELTGYSFEEMQDRPLHDVIHHKYPDGRDYPIEECPIDRALPEENQVRGEELFVHKDGHFYPVAFTASPLRNERGEAIGTVIEARNIADDQARDAALRESEARFRNMADHAPMMMWVTDADARCTYLNRAWYEFTGQSEGEAEGFGWLDAVHPDDRGWSGETFLAANARREPFRLEYRLRRHDGEYRWAIDAASPRFGERGEFLGYIGSVLDIDDRREIEEALRELNETLEHRVLERTAELEQAQDALRQSQKLEAMGQLTGGVAHDFNNLLTPIIGSLDMLQRRSVGGEREQRLIAGAIQSADRAKTLVQRLLAFARRQPLQPVPIDVAKLVSGMAELVASTSGPQIRVVVETGEDLPAALADPNQLEMAILNLSVNARDAMPEGGTLRISATPEVVSSEVHGLKPGHYVRLSVADTGTGMDEATLARAIEPFFSTKGVGRGTGLGLSMAHGLAAQLGGTLVLSSKPGLGTNVDMWLPVSAAPVPLIDAPSDPPPGSKRAGRALLVDDEELVRESTASMLEELGYEVIHAASGEDALRLVQGGLEFDLLVTDHLMPGMTGIELARDLRGREASLPVLIVSGFAEAEGIAPDLPRLTKPFRQLDLARSLSELMLN